MSKQILPVGTIYYLEHSGSGFKFSSVTYNIRDKENSIKTFKKIESNNSFSKWHDDDWLEEHFDYKSNRKILKNRSETIKKVLKNG